MCTQSNVQCNFTETSRGVSAAGCGVVSVLVSGGVADFYVLDSEARYQRVSLPSLRGQCIAFLQLEVSVDSGRTDLCLRGNNCEC